MISYHLGCIETAYIWEKCYFLACFRSRFCAEKSLKLLFLNWKEMNCKENHEGGEVEDIFLKKITPFLTCNKNLSALLPPSNLGFMPKYFMLNSTPIRLWHRCFPMNFAKFLRTPFWQNTSGRLLLKLCIYINSFIEIVITITAVIIITITITVNSIAERNFIVKHVLCVDMTCSCFYNKVFTDVIQNIYFGIMVEF